MSRTILNKRPPASPNKPPPAPAKLPLKGQPIPIDVNLLVQGNYIERAEHEQFQKKPRSAGIARITKLSDFTDFDRIKPPHHDKHILQTLAKSPSVDNSYYNKFERLDRDYVEGDTAYKEKGGRVKSASKARAVTSAPPRNRKRSKSASTAKRKPERFLDVMMSFDDETNDNTKSNAVSQISKGLLGIKGLKPRPDSAKESRRRLSSGKTRRERSASRGRSQRSESKSGMSVGSSSWCSDRTSRSEIPQTKNSRSRSSRSRTRRGTESTSNHQRRDKTPGKSRPTSAKSTKSRPESAKRPQSAKTRRKTSTRGDGFRYRESASASRKLERELVLLSQVIEKNEQPVTNRISPRKSKTKRDAAIDAVKKANETEMRLNQMREIDKLMYNEDRRYYSSSLPKLKMIVAPSATPLATLVRQSSAKMLLGNAQGIKRNI